MVRVVHDVPVDFVGGAAEQDVDLRVPPGLEDTQRMAGKHAARLRVIIDNAGRGAIDALPLPKLTRADLDECLGEVIRIPREQLFGIARDA